MALALHINADELSKFGCDPDSPVCIFWAKFAERRPTAVADMATVCNKIAQTIENDYCAESVEDMPKLLTGDQLQQVMAKEGGKPTWSGLLTYILGLCQRVTLSYIVLHILMFLKYSYCTSLGVPGAVIPLNSLRDVPPSP